MDKEESLLNILQPEDLDNLIRLSQFLKSNSIPLLQPRITILDLNNEILSFAEHNFSPKHAIGIGLSFKHFMKHFSPKREISTITRHDVEKFIIALKQKVPEGHRNYFRNLRAAFNKAIEWGYIRENPFAKIKLPKKQKVRPAYLTKEQMQKVCEYITIDVVRDVVNLSFFSGLRLSEIVHLTWKCVDLEKRTITIGTKEHNSKNKLQGIIPFEDEIYEILVRRKLLSKIKPINTNRELQSYVFAKNNGKHFTGDFFSKRFKKACREAGMPEEIHFHSLRASCACNLINKGVSIYLVKELLRHSSTAVTEVYSTADLSSLREAILKL